MDIVTGVGVLDKAVHVLRAVADRPRSLQELQAATELPRATAHRLAVALEAHGLLRRDDAGRFELGPELAALGRIASERFPLAGLALPALEALRHDTGESTQLFVREGSSRRCVLSLQSPHALRWIVPEGVLFPLELGSAGRVLLGETGRTGWVQSVEEREPGVASASAPVLAADGSVVAAVSVSGPVDRLTKQPGQRFGSRVIAAAEQIAATLRSAP
ncbi:MAG TPA: IclR family transcriptional regulator [Ilumatobacter sp.]|nr:IclR family transcriptional regulator [Ilumatobacter sp.]